MALDYFKNKDINILANNSIQKDDDSGDGYNFKITRYCNAGQDYYLVIRTYTKDKKQNFTNIYIYKQ